MQNYILIFYRHRENRLKINVSNILSEKPNYGQLNIKSVQPGNIRDIHAEYDDDDLSPK